MSFQKVSCPFPSKEVKGEIIKKYKETRDFPGIESGTSRLGVHLRFGTISIREISRLAKGLNESFLNELIWREFYEMILWHFQRSDRVMLLKLSLKKYNGEIMKKNLKSGVRE